MGRTLLFAVVFFGLHALVADDLLAQRTTTGTGTGGTQTGTGTAQATGAQTAEQLGATGMIDSNARYLRENRQAGQLVGGEMAGVGALRDQTGQTGQTGQMTQGFGRGTTGFNTGGLNQFSNLSRMSNMFGGRTGQRGPTRMNMRTSVQLGFPAPTVQASPAVVSNRVQTQIARIPRIQEMGSVTVEMQGRTAVLRGQVATEQDRALVAKMLLLEPGISDVQNELTFAPPADSAAQP